MVVPVFDGEQANVQHDYNDIDRKELPHDPSSAFPGGDLENLEGVLNVQA